MRLQGDTDTMLASLLSTLELFLPAELTKGVSAASLACLLACLLVCLFAC